MYEWLKALHVIVMVTWFAGLFYLPRLFVYHADSSDEISNARFKIMERKLFYGITTPGGILTVIFGVWLSLQLGIDNLVRAGWFHAKMALVLTLVAYHIYMGVLVRRFARDENRRTHIYYRWLNEYPVLVLIGAVIMVIVKPF